MDVELTNRGAPSSVAHWTIRYEAPLIDFTGSPMKFLNDEPFNMQSDGPAVSIRKSDTINEMTIEPVAHGKVLTGRLLFHVDRLATAPIDASKSTITISCKDFTGKTFSTVVNPGKRLTVLK
jgi:hypothetical protein